MTPKSEIITSRLCISPMLFPIKECIRIHLGWLEDAEVMRYSENRHHKHTYKLCEKYIHSFDHQHSLLWAILDKGVKKHPAEPWQDYYIGHIAAYRDVANETADLGIVIGDKLRWRSGYGLEAWRAVVEWLLANGSRKVEAGTMAANKGMLRIFEKSGMHVEGRRKAHFLFEGQPSDLVQVGRFRDVKSL